MEIKDPVFMTVAACKADNDPSKVNGTIGSLCNDDGTLTTYKTVYNVFRNLKDSDYAKYPDALRGNPDFLENVVKFVLEDNIDKSLHIEALATVGGSGAVSSSFRNFGKEGNTVLFPHICWLNAVEIAKTAGLNVVNYELFNLDDVLSKAKGIIEKEHQLMLYINDPAENPTGISIGKENWHKLIEGLNELGDYPIYIIDDVAYMDYCYDPDFKAYMKEFNNANSNILISICYSCSKSLSAYGLRLGANILLGKDRQAVEELNFKMQIFNRMTISCVSNSVQKMFSILYENHLEEYLKEKETYKEMLRLRGQTFASEAKEVGLPIYDYKDGFFVTIDIKDPELLEKFNNKLIENHIYFVKMKQGLRVAVCSINLETIKGLAARVKACLDAVM